MEGEGRRGRDGGGGMRDEIPQCCCDFCVCGRSADLQKHDTPQFPNSQTKMRNLVICPLSRVDRVTERGDATQIDPLLSSHCLSLSSSAVLGTLHQVRNQVGLVLH